MENKNPLLSSMLISDDHANNETIYRCVLSDYNALDGVCNAEMPSKIFNSKYSIPAIKLCSCDHDIYSRIKSNVPQIIIDLFDLRENVCDDDLSLDDFFPDDF